MIPTKQKRYASYDALPECPVEATLELIDGKWKGVILYYLLNGTRRFNAIQRHLGGITQRMLTKQLRELERDGLIQRTVYPQVPPRVEYALTELGHSLAPVLESLRNWGTRYLGVPGPVADVEPLRPRHDS